MKHLRSHIASTLAVIVCAMGVIALFLWSGVVRYEREVIVNTPGLALVTAAAAAPGLLLGLVAAVQIIRGASFPLWVRTSLVAAGIAAVSCVAVAIAADCVPHCKGRGGLTDALFIAVPAGFAVGALCHWMQRMTLAAMDAGRKWGA